MEKIIKKGSMLKQTKLLFCGVFFSVASFSLGVQADVLINGKTPDDHFQEAKQLDSQGEYQSALDIYHLIMSSYPALDLEDKSEIELRIGIANQGLNQLVKAQQAFERSIQYYPKSSRAMVYLAMLHSDGFVGVELNPEKMWRYFESAADLGNQDAFVQMAQRYRDGIHCDKNLEKAFTMLESAENAGHVGAKVLLSQFYADGIVVQQDKARAMELVLAAYNQGSKDAASVLGIAYYFGDLVEQDLGKAFDFFLEAAENGDIDGMRHLGVFFDNGIYVETDLNEARFWFQKASDKGDATAMVFLGIMYGEGRGVKQNREEAFKLFTKAANAGDSEAMVNLGLLYANGDYVEQQTIYRQAKNNIQTGKKTIYKQYTDRQYIANISHLFKKVTMF